MSRSEHDTEKERQSIPKPTEGETQWSVCDHRFPVQLSCCMASIWIHLIHFTPHHGEASRGNLCCSVYSLEASTYRNSFSTFQA